MKTQSHFLFTIVSTIRSLSPLSPVIYCQEKGRRVIQIY